MSHKNEWKITKIYFNFKASFNSKLQKIVKKNVKVNISNVFKNKVYF